MCASKDKRDIIAQTYRENLLVVGELGVAAAITPPTSPPETDSNKYNVCSLTF